MDLLDIGDGGHTYITFGVLPGRYLHVVGGEVPADIAGAKEGEAVDDTAISDRCFKAVRVADQPACHKAAVAAANYTHTLLVNVALLQQGFHTGHDVQRIFLGPGASHGQREVASVADAATWIGVEHNIACCDKHLHFMHEAVTVLRVWAAMNFYDQWVFLPWIKVPRLENPAVHQPAIYTGVRHIFGCRQRQLIEKGIVEAGQLAQLFGGYRRTYKNLGYARRVFDQSCHCAPGMVDAEIAHMNISRRQRWGLLACSFAGNGVYARRSSLYCQYVERFAIGRPYRCGHQLLVGHVAVRPIRATAFELACQAAG